MATAGIQVTAQSRARKVGWVLLTLVAISLVANAAIGILWISRNINFIPVYGDTTEYFELSKTLIVDQYRGILYPVIVRIASDLSQITGLTTQSLIYSFQIIVAILATYSLAMIFLRGKPRAKLLSAIIAISVTLNPLVAHFCLTILTDSLAASFTIIFAASLIRACKNDSSVKKAALQFFVASIALILMSIIRVDKLYLATTVFSLSLIFIGLFSRKNHNYKAIAITGLLMFAASVAITVSIKNSTTVYNQKRPPLDISSMGFNRAVWPRMVEVYPYLSDSVKQRVSIDDATLFDSHNNYVYPLLTRELDKPEGKHIIDEITLTTIKNFPGQIASSIVFDFAKYSMPNLQFPLEAYDVLPQSVGTSWTISRMEMLRPLTTHIFLVTGWWQLFALSLFAAYSIRKKCMSISDLLCAPYTALIISSTVVINSLLFTLSSGMHTHIRYSLPTYTIFQIILLAIAARHIQKNENTENI